ncbi:efflux transporter outer membrane subunit [Sphingomonas nostoxanthinifaciens]|uniref:efflux transporter outer membrane subunit n=1 Tax=Sphingomonas nostoxanthinifaciens TaxID=2872652 RepID=UPI001CC20872|nr:efflux transporter outer membrane subunit [Sphingomonas nostoxanthinifaciens]UAK26368.1 efflux transporter outer membrane subunit [Sphingomonas nostoxanthinifaciens]
MTSTKIARFFGYAGLLALAGCSFAPHYHVPATSVPASFKEAPGWRSAAPADAVAKGEWWLLFNDPVLTALEQRVRVNNQNVLAAVAAYDLARATVREARAALFPDVTLSSGATRAGTFGSGSTTIIGGTSTSSGSTTGTGSTGTGTGTGTGTTTGSTGTSTVTSSSNGSRRYTVSAGASWEPDLWGRLRNTLTEQKNLAQASEADLNNATLAAQGELALDYVQLRGLEAQKAILDDTVAAYAKALTITTNRYNQGVVAQVDVLQAQTQLTTAKANAADLVRQRAIFEHAIAVLVGENPSSFVLAAQAWNRTVPAVPAALPASLLERRPDIAAAERRVASANAAIGIQRAAFFPTLSLTGSVGGQSSVLSNLFTAGASIWSLGAQGALTVLDFGARSARVAEARASYNQAVATYRQTVLAGFQQVEDELAASGVLAYVGDQRVAAAQAATRVQQLTQNQYLAGQIVYTDVITAQATALSARQSEAQAIVDRQVAAVTLIQAIGGSWPAATTPTP